MAFLAWVLLVGISLLLSCGSDDSRWTAVSVAPQVRSCCTVYGTKSVFVQISWLSWLFMKALNWTLPLGGNTPSFFGGPRNVKMDNETDKNQFETLRKIPSHPILLSLSGSSWRLSPSRSEGYPPYGFQPVGPAAAADPAPTFLDAPRPPLHPGPPPLHWPPITWTLHSLRREGVQSTDSMPSWQPQGRNILVFLDFLHLFLFVCFSLSSLCILPFPLGLIPCYPPLFLSHTHMHAQTHKHSQEWDALC